MNAFLNTQRLSVIKLKRNNVTNVTQMCDVSELNNLVVEEIVFGNSLLF